MKTDKVLTWVVVGLLVSVGVGCKSLGIQTQSKSASSHESAAILLRLDAPLLLTVDRKGEDSSYQWRRNGRPIAGATSYQYSVAKVTIKDVGVYDCIITEPHGNGRWLKTHFSESTEVFVYHMGRALPQQAAADETERVRVRSAETALLASATTNGSTPFTVWGGPLPTSVSGSTCPKPYSGYINYRPTDTRWGWFMTSSGPHTGADGYGATTTKVEYICSNGTHFNCGAAGSVSTRATEKPAHSCRFTIYFPPGMTLPESYPITLTGFIE